MGDFGYLACIWGCFGGFSLLPVDCLFIIGRQMGAEGSVGRPLP